MDGASDACFPPSVWPAHINMPLSIGVGARDTTALMGNYAVFTYLASNHTGMQSSMLHREGVEERVKGTAPSGGGVWWVQGYGRRQGSKTFQSAWCPH